MTVQPKQLSDSLSILSSSLDDACGECQRVHVRTRGRRAQSQPIPAAIRWFVLGISLAALSAGCGPVGSSRTSGTPGTSGLTNDVSRKDSVPSSPAPTTDQLPPASIDSRRAAEPAQDAVAASEAASEAAAEPPPQSPRNSVTQPVNPTGVNDITFDDLKLDMPVGTLFDRSMLTPRAAELDGQRVRLRGFIFAGGVFQQSGIRSFPFVMNTQCKFGPQGEAFCVILVDLDEGVTTEFTTYPVTVEGRLTVRPYDEGGFTWSVYHLQGQRVY